MRLDSKILSTLVLALAPAFALLACAAPSAHPPAASAPAEILWDEWGVAHIFAASDANLFYAQGWAQAQAHGDLLLELYGRARARGAEYWGERWLESDRWLATNGVPDRAVEWYAAQKPAERTLLDAFVRGVNDYARAHPEAIADRVEPVLPVAAEDVLAHVQAAIHFTFVIDRGRVEGAAQRLSAPGSNAWAVAPARSASGKAMLVANPHLPWSDLFTWFESQLVSPAVDAYGVSLVGTPFLGIAFNDHLAWTHTVNTHDGADLYQLELEGEGYRFDGEVKPFERRTRTLKVRQPDGSMKEEALEIRRSVHGPVVAAEGNKALALRVVGLDQPHLTEQYWNMAAAKDLAGFEAALDDLQMPMFTVIYADDAGHVLHLFGGHTPVRPAGDWDWSGTVPGDTSKTLWTATHPYGELPRVADPPSGWLQNANDPPWTTTFPPALDPGAFPRYMAPRFMHFRAQRSARMLKEDEQISFDELTAYKLSTRMELADRILDDLARAVEAHGDETAKRAMAVLSTWDRSADAGSRGAVLFQRLWRGLTRGGKRPFSTPWNESEPLSTPDGFADAAAVAVALSAAAAEVQAEHGALDVAWGDVHRLRLDGRDLPANGGPSSLGIFRVTEYEAVDSHRQVAEGGDSYVAVVELTNPARARVLLSYGNWSQPGSRHRGDQLELFSKKELRPAWRTRAEIEAHLERREAVTPGAL